MRFTVFKNYFKSLVFSSQLVMYKNDEPSNLYIKIDKDVPEKY